MSCFDRRRGSYTIRVGERFVSALSFSLTDYISRAERFTGPEAEGWAQRIRLRGHAAEICDLQGKPAKVTYSKVKPIDDPIPSWASDAGYAR